MADNPQEHIVPHTSPFDAIRHLDGEREFWRARELSKILGYNRWENFENVIAKAKIACKFNGHDVDLNFREVTKISRIGSRGGKRNIRDVELTRYACYILVQSSDRRAQGRIKRDRSRLHAPYLRA